MREQEYSKDYSNRIKGDNTIFDIAIKDSKGHTTYVKKTLCEGEVKAYYLRSYQNIFLRWRTH